jgi:hypothetical protein
MQSIANGSQFADQTPDEPNPQSINNSSNADLNQQNGSNGSNGSNSNGIAFNGLNDQLNETNNNTNNNSNSDNKLINIKSRTDQDIIRLIGQHLRVLGLKYEFLSKY